MAHAVPEGFAAKWIQIPLDGSTLPDVRIALAEDKLRLHRVEGVDLAVASDPVATFTLTDLLADTENALRRVNQHVAVFGTFWRREGFAWPPPALTE